MPSPFEPGCVVADRFEVEREYARGAMGSVAKAVDRQTGNPVALKRLLNDAGNRARFRHEGRLLARLDDPRIVRLVEEGEDEHGPWLAMEWIAGPTLERLIARGGIQRELAIELGAQLAEALVAAHARGVVHRDVKPANLILASESPPRIKLVDFGVARATDASTVLTRTGAAIGTPLYMAPEQLRGEIATSASDVYGASAVLFEILTGRPPFVAEGGFAVIARILLEPAPSLHELGIDAPNELERLLRAGLSKSASERPRSEELARSLRALADSAAVAATVMEGTVLRPTVDVARETRTSAVMVISGMPSVEVDLHASAAEPSARDVLPDGTCLLLFTDPRSSDASLLRAVRLGLALLEGRNEARIAVAAGRASTLGGSVAGEAIDRIAHLPIERPGLWTDHESATLLRDRFELDDSGPGAVRISGEGLRPDRRLLLGKATPTVGRHAELAQLEAVFDATLDDGAPRIALVTGQPGRGKSRLRLELVDRLQSRSPPVRMLLVRFEPASEGTPWAALGRALRVAAGVPAELDDTRTRLAIRELLGSRAREIDHEFLAEVAGAAASPPSETLAFARDVPDAMRGGILEALFALARTDDDGDPAFTLVLEDAHWADLATLRVVDEMLADAALSIAVFVFARPELTERLDELWSRRNLLNVALAPLAARSATRLARHALPPDVSTDVIERIVAMADGSPLVIEELVREFSASKRLAPSLSARTVFESAIGKLSDGERLVARAAATVGEVFWDTAVRAALSQTDTNVSQLLGMLVRAEMISERDSSRYAGSKEFIFRHALVRDAAAASVPDDVRRHFHAAIAGWMTQLPHPDHVALAEHAERAGLAELAGTSLLRVARAATAASDVTGALPRLERAVALLAADHPAHFEALVFLEDATRDLSHRVRRLRYLARIKRLASKQPTTSRPRVLAQLLEARYLGDRGDERSLVLSGTAASSARESALHDLGVEIGILSAELYRESGDANAALASLAVVSDHLDTVPAARRAEFYRIRGTISRRFGQSKQAIDSYQRALAIVSELAVPRAFVLTSLGYALFTDWRLADADAAFVESVELLTRHGVRKTRAKSTANLGSTYYAVGEYALARELYDRAIELHRENGDDDGFADTLALRARASIHLAELDDAERFLVESEARAQGALGAYDRLHTSIARLELEMARAKGSSLAALADQTVETLAGTNCRSFELAGVALSAAVHASLGNRDRALELTHAALAVYAAGTSLEWAPESFAALLRAAPDSPDAKTTARHWLSSTRNLIGSPSLLQSFEQRAEIRFLTEALGPTTAGCHPSGVAHSARRSPT